jgi:hypothetical protein
MFIGKAPMARYTTGDGTRINLIHTPGRTGYYQKGAFMEQFEKRLACVIREDGSIARGYLIESCQFDGSNKYTITWKIPLQGEVKTNFAATIGSATDEAVQPGLITVGLEKNPKQMQVHTYDPDGKPAARSFHLACFRD